jgi:cysteinyl-tRNA synthetase
MRALATLAAAGEAYLLAKESDFAASGALTNARTQFSVPPEPLALCARLVAKMSTLFGIESVASAYMPASAETSNADGTPVSNTSGSVSNTSGSAGEALHVLTDFRAQVRAAAKRALVANAKAAKAAKKAAAAKEDDGASPSRDEDGLKSSDTVAASALAQELLEMCDKLRDEVLPEKLGVALEDRPSGKAHVTTLRK